MTASDAQKLDAANDKPVLPVDKSVFRTGLPVHGGKIRPDLGGARQNRPVHRGRWCQGEEYSFLALVEGVGEQVEAFYTYCMYREAQAQQEPISLFWTSNKLISMQLFLPKAK
jgi:hypothetical protein